MEEIEESGTAVELYIYDLTKGMAAMMSKIVIGKILSKLKLLTSLFIKSTEKRLIASPR